MGDLLQKQGHSREKGAGCIGPHMVLFSVCSVLDSKQRVEVSDVHGDVTLTSPATYPLSS